MIKNKKILFTVHNFLPEVGGAGEVVYRLAKKFAAAGYETTVATNYVLERDRTEIEGIKIKQFKIGGNKAKGYQGAPEEIKRYIDFVVHSDFNAIVNYAAQIWHTDLTLENIDQIPCKKIIVPCGYSALKDPRFGSYFKWLPQVLKKYDHLIYLSETYQDIKFHRQHGLKNEIIIPNGADEEEFLTPAREDIRSKYQIKSPYLALCVSNYFWLKGQDFVIRAFNKLRRDDISLVLIGCHQGRYYPWVLKFLARDNPRIISLKKIPRPEVVDFFKAADFFLFGSRIECSPLVMFESFASKTLFITRAVGNTQEYASYNVIVNSPSEMKNAVERAIENKEFREQKIESAFQKYLKDHTYEVLFKKYQGLVEA